MSELYGTRIADYAAAVRQEAVRVTQEEEAERVRREHQREIARSDDPDKTKRHSDNMPADLSVAVERMHLD